MKHLQGRDFLGIADLNEQEIKELLQLATELKTGQTQCVINKVLGLLFYKASTRTRVSFTVAMYQLGGQVIDINPKVTQVGRGEPIEDTARVLDRYLDVLAIRTFSQEDIQTFAQYAQMPIINALTDLEHPCQILADFLTIQECFGTLEGITLTYLGDGNNVAHSLLLGAAIMGMNIRVATPDGYQPNREIVAIAKQLAKTPSAEIILTENPVEAVKGASVLYTDVWASMGQEDSAKTRIPLFQPYQLREELFDCADSKAIALHCLPAHRGEEITAAVLESVRSRVFDQAENRLHVQKALLVALLGSQ